MGGAGCLREGRTGLKALCFGSDLLLVLMAFAMLFCLWDVGVGLLRWGIMAVLGVGHSVLAKQ